MNTKITMKGFTARVEVTGDFSAVDPQRKASIAREHVPLTLNGCDLKAITECCTADGVGIAVAEYVAPAGRGIEIQNSGLRAAHPLVCLAMSMYTGEKCQGCGKTFDTAESLRDSVWWPWKEGRVGHKACYEKANARPHGGREKGPLETETR